jgi:hypothetical protein
VVELRALSVGILELADGGEVGDHRSEQRRQLVGRRLRALAGEVDEVLLSLEECLYLLGLSREGESQQVQASGG